MTVPDWLGYKVAKGLLWLNPITHVVGLAIAIWAWYVTRKTGYIVIALFFLLVVLGKSSPGVVRVVYGPSKAQLPNPQQAQEYTQQATALDKRYFPAGHPQLQSIPFPLGPIVLVAGLWVLVKRDMKRQGPQPTPAADPSSDQRV